MIFENPYINQKEAGADIIQIFDTWAGFINDEDLKNIALNQI